MKFWLLICTVFVGCAGYAGHWWDRDHALWVQPPAKPPEVSNIEPMPAQGKGTISAALERPVFWATRRPPPPPKAPTQDDRLIEELNKSVLLAVLQSGEQRVALLRAPDGRTVKYTHQSRPWRLELFDGRQATFITEEGIRAVRILQSNNKR